MKHKDFDRLVTTIKQAGAIRRGRLKPGHVTEFRPDDVPGGSSLGSLASGVVNRSGKSPS
jgi:hypothetical protein